MEGALTVQMKVGDLARRAGITVRTLHHYDEIGLLTPLERTPAGHRLYGRAELERLQRIASLRHLGLSLDQIRDCLARPEYSLERVLGLHVERLEEEIARKERLRDLLSSVRNRLRATGTLSVGDITRTIEVTMRYEKHYTEAQLAELASRREHVGEDRILRVQEEWQELFAAYGKAMEAGVDPASEDVKALARRSAALVSEFTGGDPGIAASLGDMYRREGPENVTASHGMETPPGLWEYMGKAAAALGREA